MTTRQQRTQRLQTNTTTTKKKPNVRRQLGAATTMMAGPDDATGIVWAFGMFFISFHSLFITNDIFYYCFNDDNTTMKTMAVTTRR